MAGAASPKFTLRFEHPQTHELLRLVADHFGTSMNALAEDMISRELQALGLTAAPRAAAAPRGCG
jgi:predicted HicB family RNase H-like nuclease